MIIRLIAGLIKKILLYKMKQYFPKLHEHFDRDISVKKANLKEATDDDTSNMAAKSDFARLEAEVGKIDMDKLN